MQSDLEKLKALLFSSDQSNIELALSLSESQGYAEIAEIYQQMQRINNFWIEHPLEGYPKAVHLMFDYFRNNGLRFFKNYTVKEIPEEHKLLAPFVRSFYIWYTSLHTLPKGIGNFYNIEEIEIVGGPLTHLLEEVWKLPNLRIMNLTIGKNFVWDDKVRLAQNIKVFKVKGVVYPSLPEDLPLLPKLNTLGYTALGNPKESTPLPDCIWHCKHLEQLELFGKTIPMTNTENFEKLSKLKSIDLGYMNWETLPESFLSLNQLESLVIYNFIKMKELPESFAQLPIKRLSLKNCKFKNAMKVLSSMPNLRSLTVTADVQKNTSEEDWKKALPNVELSYTD